MEWMMRKLQNSESQFLIWESQSVTKVIRCEHCTLKSTQDQKELGSHESLLSSWALRRT